MNFTEKSFLLFLPAVFGLWLLFRKWPKVSQTLLLIASLVFYAFHEWELVFLILAYCVVDWSIGLWIERSQRPKLVLSLGVAFNLLGLAFWKYTPLLVHSVGWFLLRLDYGTQPPQLDNWFLPIGISFYAFTGIAYMVDVYRQETNAERNPWTFALYISFFPQLVAGPILRAHEFLNKLKQDTMPTKTEAPLEAMTLMARGFFKKMVLADRIALAIDPYFAHIADPTTAGVWSLPYVYLYAFQIYFDFSGYTDIARGIGLLFGFRWPENFNAPYLARSVQEFWQRWHITLSRFLRDYLYIPLGGNRHGWIATTRNLMITMLLGGLWHGASWTFMIWGGLHGLYLVLHRAWQATLLSKMPQEAPRWFRMVWNGVAILVTFNLVCLAWCFFRLSVLSQVWTCILRAFRFETSRVFVGGSGDLSLWLLLATYALLALVAQKIIRLSGWRESEGLQPSVGPFQRGLLWGTAAGLLLLAFVLSPGGEKPPFIYFRF